MARQTRHTVIALLSSTLITLLLIEGGLKLLDPWGVDRYLSDMVRYFSSVQAAEQRGYVLAPGQYRFSNWQADILPDTTRRVPDTHAAATCTLALVGDSVTFAHGVSDGDTWANQLARYMSDVRIVNAGVDGYNTLDALHTIRAIPAQAYVYLLTGNDHDAPTDWRRVKDDSLQNRRGPLVSAYLYFATSVEAGSGIDASFYPSLAALNAIPNVVIVGFNHIDEYAILRQRYPRMRWIPLYHYYNSRADFHPNPAGNREVAAAILPLARALVDHVCPVI